MAAAIAATSSSHVSVGRFGSDQYVGRSRSRIWVCRNGGRKLGFVSVHDGDGDYSVGARFAGWWVYLGQEMGKQA